MEKISKKSDTLKFIVKPIKVYYEGYCLGGCGTHNQGTCGTACAYKCDAQRH